jgi:hypothetical protein
MPKRSAKEDANQAAHRIVGTFAGALDNDVLAEAERMLATVKKTSRASVAPKKNQAAVELGRLGGKKGGPARAAKLSKAQLTKIGKLGARKRWAAKRKSE